MQLGGGLLRAAVPDPVADIVADRKQHTVDIASASESRIVVKVIWRYPISDEEKEIQFNNISKAPAFVNWCTKMDTRLLDNVVFTTIIIHSVDMAGPRVLFIKFSTDMKYNQDFVTAFNSSRQTQITPNINSIVFLRGGSVAILVVLNCADGKKYSIITQQTRVPIGNFCMEEIPAGMLDGSNNFAGVAAMELKEEADIHINRLELEDLLDPGGNPSSTVTFPSPGGCDETMRFFLYEPLKTFTVEEIDTMRDKMTGALEEGEVIRVKIVTLESLREKVGDMKTMTALYLYDRYMYKIAKNQTLSIQRIQSKQRNEAQSASERLAQMEEGIQTLQAVIAQHQVKLETSINEIATVKGPQ